MSVQTQEIKEITSFEVEGYVFKVTYNGKTVDVRIYKDNKRISTLSFEPKEKSTCGLYFGAVYDEAYNNVDMFFDEGHIITAYIDGQLIDQTENLDLAVSGYLKRIDIKLPQGRKRTIKF